MSVSLVAPPTPFKGLSPFDESELDALFFFGREREREVVVANLMASRLTVLFGPSGVGKTSLLRAGVAHALRPVPDADVIVFSAWPVDPLHGLREAIAEAADLDDADHPLPDLLAAAASALGGDIYVILDQFEEYFLYHDPDDGEPLADELAESIRRPGLRANFLLGIREDALAKLDVFKGRIPGLFSNSLHLDRLDRAAGEAAIVGPVNAYNTLVAPERRVELEPALVAGLLDEVTTGRVDLGVAGRGRAAENSAAGRIEAPYLQLVLERLWDEEARAGSRRLRLATLAGLGGASHIVHEHLDRAMAGLSPREQDAAAAMYNHLVTPSGTKIALVVADLAGYASVDETEAASVLRRLSAERIVRAGENGGSDRYEIYHDVLAGAVVAWRTRYMAERRLEEQQREAERRHRRLIRVLGAAFAALAVVAAIAIYALVQRSEAQHQTAVAQAERVNAEHQTQIAKAQKKEADKQKKAAQKNAAVAKQKTQQAKTAQANAEASNQKAQEQTQAANAANADAQSAQADAEEQSRQADKQRAKAVAATHVAQRQRKAAIRARTQATHQARIRRAKRLEADARALVTTDPVKATESALAAVRAYRLAGLRFTPRLEEALRGAFLALRLSARLPTGAGPARVAAYSHDGSLVAVAGERGARIYDLRHRLAVRRLYDLRHRFAVRRLLPGVGLRAIDFSPDDRLLAGAGDDGAVHVWDTSTGVPLAALRHGGGPVRTVAFSPDGRLLASGGSDGWLRLWSVTGWLPLWEREHPAGGSGGRKGVFSVSFGPDGRRLLTVGGDRFARVFDVATGKLDLRIDNTTLVSAAAFSHDGRLIATGSGANSDPFIHIWNATTGGPAGQPLRGGGNVTDLAFSPNDSLLAAGGSNDTIARVWSLADRSAQAIFPGHNSGVVSVDFSPNSGSVVSSGRDGRAIIWSSVGGFVQATLAGHQRAVNDATFSPDGQSVLTAGDDGTARIWDVTAKNNSESVADHGAAVNAVAFSPDGRTVLSAGSDGTARLTRGTHVLTLKHEGAVVGGGFDRAGRLVITASADKTARVWSAATGAVVRTLDHGAAVNVARLSPNGRIALTGGDDGVIRLWDVRTGRQLQALQHGGQINDARFGRGGQLVVSASSDGTAAVWRVVDGRRLHTLRGHGDSVLAAVFSRDGRRIATASSDSTARIWNARTGQSLHTLSGHERAVTAVAFSPGGRFVATSSLDRDARLWDARTGKELNVLSIHAGLVSDVAFSFDGRWLATAGPGSFGIWDVGEAARGEWSLVYLVKGDGSPINDIAFSPHGWKIVTGSREGHVRTFDCPVCGRTPLLAKLAAARLREIVYAKP